MTTAFNIIIIVLLVYAIGYALVINYRLNLFEKNKQDIIRRIADFNQQILSEQKAFYQMNLEYKKMMDDLNNLIKKASIIRSDLSQITPANSKVEEKNIEPTEMADLSEVEKELLKKINA